MKKHVKILPAKYQPLCPHYAAQTFLEVIATTHLNFHMNEQTTCLAVWVDWKPCQVRADGLSSVLSSLCSDGSHTISF